MFDKLKSGFSGLVQKISQKDLSDKEISQILDEFLLILVQNDVAYSVAKKICDGLQERLRTIEVKRFTDGTEPAKAALRSVLLDLLSGSGEEPFFKVLDEKKRE